MKYKRKDRAVYFLLRLDEHSSLNTFVDNFNERYEKDDKVRVFYRHMQCNKIEADEPGKCLLFIRMDPRVMGRTVIAMASPGALKEGLRKVGYDGAFESCKDKKMIEDYAEKYVDAEKRFS